jgi:hypothetical protein
MTARLLGITLAALVAMSCANATSRGGVRPAPPGPFDLVRGAVFGDFSGLCPKHYDFCGGGRDSICCPMGGCCSDENGPYCCAGSYGSHGGGYAYQREEETREYSPCRSQDITCSQGGRTICCTSNDSCCVDSSGPYCCAVRSQSQTYERYDRYDDTY